ncbi:MAG: hypothetical protein U0746_15500 [Gemmataceae bacterium]
MRSASLLTLFLASAGFAADLDALVRRVKAVGPEGAGNRDAAAAWKELSQLDGTSLVPLLKAFDGASGIAANYLRSAVDAVVEHDRVLKKPLPTDALKAFLTDRKNDARARRIAYELIVAADPKATAMLPTFLDDPSLELRYEAVQTAFDATKALPKDSAPAKTELRKLLSASRDKDQAEAIVRELDARGEKVDTVAHFGFLTHWTIAGPFDNTNGKAYTTAFPPDQGVDFKATYTGKGGRNFGWKPLTTSDKMGVVNLNLLYPRPNAPAAAKEPLGEKNVVAFGYTEVVVPEARPAELRAASATALVLYLNGARVFGRESYHQSFDVDSYIAPVTLKKGRNTILFKVVQNDGQASWMQNWQFQLRITDALGAPVPLTQIKPEDFGKETP